MADNFTVRGAEDFLALSKSLKDAGQLGMRKDLNVALRDAVKPLIPKTRAAARATLPTKGGMAEKVARAPQRAQVRTGQQTAGVRLVVGARRGSAAWAANRGLIRHPVWPRGDDRKKWTWVEQAVTPGWFDETLKREAPGVAHRAIAQAIEDMLQRVAREAASGGGGTASGGGTTFGGGGLT